MKEEALKVTAKLPSPGNSRKFLHRETDFYTPPVLAALFENSVPSVYKDPVP